MLFQTFPRPLPKLVDSPPRFGYSDDRHVQRAALDHVLERRENLFVREIAGGTKKDQCVGERRGAGGKALFRDAGRQGGAHLRTPLYLLVRAFYSLMLGEGGFVRARWHPAQLLPDRKGSGM